MVGLYYQKQSILRKLALRKNFEKSAEKEKKSLFYYYEFFKPTYFANHGIISSWPPIHSWRNLSNASHNLIPQ